jgi:homoserine kinase
MTQLEIRVPASTANLGAGFDCLALALDLHNVLHVVTTSSGLEINVEGEGQDVLPANAENLVARAALKLFRSLDVQPPGLRIRCVNQVPLAAGLGSSAAATVAGLMLAATLADHPLSQSELLAHASEIEGHPDNAAAALLGGLVIVSSVGSGLITRQVPIAKIRLVIAVPDVQLSTTQMRRVLPHNVPVEDAAFNIGRTALTIEALRSGDFELMAQAIDDRIHQPYRKRLIPGYEQARQSALQAGAAAVVLSGAGPGLIALTPDGHDRVSEAMLEGFRSQGLTARSYVLRPTATGAQIRTLNLSNH